MLADWYFCSSLRLTILQTSEYLDTLEILRTPTSSDASLKAALEWLSDAESSLVTHAFATVLGASDRLRTEPTLSQQAGTIWTDLLAESNDRSDATTQDHSPVSRLGPLIREAFEGPDDDFSERVVAAVGQLRPKRGREMQPPHDAEPYHDLHDYIVESVALTLLDLAGQLDPEALQAVCTGPTRMPIVDQAIANSLGRLPLLLAASVLTRVAPTQTSDEVRDSLADAGQGAGDLEPDLLRTLAETWFGRAETTADSESEMIEREINSGRLFRLWRRYDRAFGPQRTAALSRLGTVRTPEPSVEATVWQLTLWELISSKAPQAAARLTQTWWGPPGDHRDDAFGDHGLPAVYVSASDTEERKRIGEWLFRTARTHWFRRPSGELSIVGETEGGAAPSTVCSPWIDRRDSDFRLDQVVPVNRRPGRSHFPRAGESLLMLQLLTTTAAAIQLLRATQSDSTSPAAPRTHLLALIFHCKDVLTDVRFRFFLNDLGHRIERPADLPLSPPLAALAWHVLRSVDRAGKGDYAEIPAALFGDFLLDGPGTSQGGADPVGGYYSGIQWARLFSAPALQVARGWIEESAAGVRRERSTEATQHGWFDGQIPYAKRVLVTAVERLSGSASQNNPSSSQPTIGRGLASAQLLRQEFPGTRIGLDTDWMSQLPELIDTYRYRVEQAKQRGYEANSPLTPRLLLAADPYPLARWIRHSAEVELLATSGASRTAMVTLRLAALLRETEPNADDDVPEWVDDWFQLMSMVNDPSGWARAARGIAVDLFTVPRGKPPAQERMRIVAEAVIDNIIEFSSAAPRYYQRLLDALAGDSPLYEEGMDRLRVRAVRAIGSQLRANREPRRRFGPRDRLTEQETHESIERLRRAFVANVGRSGLSWDDRRTLCDAFLDSWLRTGIHEARKSELRSSEAESDPRFVVARTMDHYTGMPILGVVNASANRTAAGDNITDLWSLTSDERAKTIGRWRQDKVPRLVSAAVCAHDEADPAGRTLFVNWGGRAPLRVVEKSGARRRLGDPCVVKISWNPDEKSWEHADFSPVQEVGRRQPEPDEVRSATVELAHHTLSVRVDGVPGDILRTATGVRRTTLLRYWDADLSRCFAPKHTVTENESSVTLARWHEDADCWLPVDRSLTELIAGDMPYNSNDGKPSTVLTYVGPEGPAESEQGYAWRFATRPGRTFLLTPSDWTTSREQLEQVLEHGPGVLVYAELVDAANPRLALLLDPPPAAEDRWPALTAKEGGDTRNIDWLDLFANSQENIYEARLNGDTWSLDVSTADRFRPETGFPAIVTISGLNSAGSSPCAFTAEPWDEDGARRAEVTGQQLREESLDVDVTHPTAEQFADLWDVRTGQTFALERFYQPRNVRRTFTEALTSNGITVRVDRDSMPFASLSNHPGALPVAVEVTRVTVPNPEAKSSSASPLPAEELAPLFPGGIPAGTRLNAIVVAVFRSPAGALAQYLLWLDTPGTPKHHKVPAGCFTSLPRRPGEPCVGVLSSDGWQFTPTKRFIYTRALHRFDTAEEPPATPWRYLGSFIDHSGKRSLYGRSDGGSLVSVPEYTSPGRPVGLNGTVVQMLGGGTPRNRVQTDRVLVSTGSIEIVGDVPKMEVVSGSVSRIKLVVSVNRDGLMSFRRELTVADVARATANSDRRLAIEDIWRQRLAAGELVQISGRLADHGVYVDGVKLSLLENDRPYITGMPYSSKRVAAIVVEHGVELRACTRLVPPRTPAEFAEEMLGGVPTAARRQELNPFVYYVGAERIADSTARRFEWGLGSTVLLRDDELTVNGEPCYDEHAFPMFHGDRLVAAEFVVDPRGKVVVNIDPERDVAIHTAGEVAREAAKHIVHRLVVDVDADARRVTVKQVHMRRMRIRAEQADHSERRTLIAELTNDSREAILAILAAGPRTHQKLVSLEILARFDRDEYRRSRGRIQQFSYVESRFAAAGSAGLQPDEFLFMVAGAITRPTENDTYIEFRLPSSVLHEPGADTLTVRVSRRQFSCREYLLPQLFDEGRSSYYKDRAVMLVQVRRGDRDGRWHGDLTNSPARPADTLASAVDQAGGSVLAATTGSRGRKVELRPGVICDLGNAQGADVSSTGRGALVRISRHLDGLRVVLAQRPDRDYVPTNRGRPALLLPKEPLLRGSGLRRAGEPLMFTVAGLPAVSVTAGHYGRSALRTPHPRVAMLRTQDDSLIAEPPKGEPVRAAKVNTFGEHPIAKTVIPRGAEPTDGSGAARVHSQFEMLWSRLSFRDTDVETIRQLCEQTWSYHDAKTGHWSGGREPRIYTIANRNLASEPVFFDEQAEQWTLRYSPRRISTFGNPATALTERRPHHDQPADDDKSAESAIYAVACPAIRPGKKDPWGIWIELGPGRVVEVGGPLLVGPGKYTLDDLAWQLFGPGDTVRLELLRSNITEPRRLRLIEWHPSPRSALLPDFSNGRALITVHDVDSQRGRLRLGAGDYKFDYPLSPAQAAQYKRGTALFLDRTNGISPAATSDVRPGDTALLTMNGADLQLMGMDDCSIELAAGEHEWPGMQWLADALMTPDRAALMSALGGCLPVTIEEIKDQAIVISRRQQPSGNWPTRGLLRCVCSGSTGNQLILRSGGAIFRLPVTNVVRGIPRNHTVGVAQTLAAGRHLVWCRPRREGAPITRLRPPSSATAFPDEYDAVPVGIVGPSESPAGLILRGVDDHGYRWMQAEQASWLEHPTKAELTKYLVEPRTPIRVRESGDARVSAISVRGVNHERLRLRLGTALRVEPLARSSVQKGCEPTTVARVCSTKILLRLEIEPEDCTIGEPILAEVDQLGAWPFRHAVRAVLNGHRRHTVDLPARLTTGTPERAAQAQDELAALHSYWWNEGLRNRADESDNVDEALLRTAGDVVRGVRDDRRGAAAVDNWLAKNGDVAFNLQPGGELELAPLLAACILIARRGKDDATAACAAVLLTHQTGLRASRSLHVETVTRHWLPLGRDNGLISIAAHARLQSLVLPPAMDNMQLRSALWFGHGILARTEDGSLDDGSAAIARAVLAAVGRLPAGTELADDAEILAPISGLGRALHPPVGESVAQSELVPAQIDLLSRQLRRALELPIALLPIPSRDVLTDGARSLAKAFLNKVV